ncbi:MAG TPA: chemotaxis-specific protein-glutamate methyltransferase CheB [Solirubrobacterales bacterium]|nr:chemotaxis-specific protein-glutamate methyltransferase CheB [Solirubrobacterales bacterium]
MTASPRPRRVLLCEDSKAYAIALSRFLGQDDQIEVVGVSASGEEAIADVKELQPDLLTLDMKLPGIDGLEVVKRLMGENPLPIVILTGTVAKGSERAAEALAAGALDVLPKERLRLDQLDDIWAQAMRSRLRRLSSMRVGRPPRMSASTRRRASEVPPRVAQVVGVGASTGGPPVLEAILAELPADFPVPLLIVQHMAPGFIEGFAKWLDRKLPIAVRLAGEGDRATPGVWFAPDGAHLTLAQSNRFVLDRETEAPHRPSIDVLLGSLARGFGTEAVGVVLTGMGKDGAEGAAAIRREGGLAIAQDEASSVVYGMPRAVADGGADLVLPPAEIADILGALRPAREVA